MLTMDKAQLIIEAAIETAKKIGQPMNIAIVDAGANLMAFMRMDGAWLGSIDIAINKAFTKQPARRPVLRHPRIEPRPGDDLRRRHPDQDERPDCGRRWRQRRQRRAGPGGGGGSGCCLLVVSMPEELQ
jgi:hypothetical protein